MKKPIYLQALYATSLFAISLATINANAALTRITAQPKTEEAIVDDAITPEAPVAEETVVVKRSGEAATNIKTRVRKAPLRERETELAPAEEAPIAPVVATKPSAGQQLDAGLKAKMEDVQNQFEQALIKSLDRVKVTVDDGGSAQGSATPTQAVVVQDSLAGGKQGAVDKNAYIGVGEAQAVSDADEATDADGQSIVKDEKKNERKLRVSPVFGKTSLSSDIYNINARYTVGFELEYEVDTNFALVFGYSYSQYDVGVSGANSFYGYYQPYGSLGTLGYNQNLFELGGRVYLMPKESKFRVFGGAGLGYNLGYLNYSQNQYVSSPMYNPYGYNTPDYSVKDWMGILSAGAELNVSSTVSVGALFKYGLVLSSTQNQPLSNYAFSNGYYGSAPTASQAIVGGSLARDNFFSILGTVKVSF